MPHDWIIPSFPLRMCQVLLPPHKKKGRQVMGKGMWGLNQEKMQQRKKGTFFVPMLYFHFFRLKLTCRHRLLVVGTPSFGQPQ